MKVNMYRHIFYTWLLANLLYPLTYLIYGWIVYEGSFSLKWDELGFIPITLFYSIIFTIPSFFISMIGFRIIILSPLRPVISLLAWCLNVVLSIVANASLVMYVFIGEVDLIILSFSTPGIIAGLTAIFIRYPQFRRLLQSWRQPNMLVNTNESETN